MPLLASTVLTSARILLNDPTGAIFPDTPMYGLMDKTYKELQTRLNAIGVSTAKEITSPAIDVPPGTLALIEGALLPANLVYPVDLQERRDGGTDDDWVDMEEQEWGSTVVQSSSLRFWAWREEEIKFPGATVAREVKIKYIKSLGAITGAASTILILNSETWMAQRLASLAALLLGSNPTRASALNSDLATIWEDLKATLVKRKQAIPVRRRRTRYRVL